MKNFETKIKESFGEYKMPQGHEERFMKLIEESKSVKYTIKRQRKLSIIIKGLSVAAVLLISALLIKPLIDERKQRNELCENIEYADYVMNVIREDILTKAEKRLSHEELTALKQDLEQMFNGYERVKEMSDKLDRDYFNLLLFETVSQNQEMSENILASL